MEPLGHNEAAYHEAGHAVVSVWIREEVCAVILFCHKEWKGVHATCKPKKLDYRGKAMVAVAGMLAQARCLTALQ
jgi:hypothetical protein